MDKIVEVFKYMNYSGGAVYKLHLTTKITREHLAALRMEFLSEEGLLHEWISVGSPRFQVGM